jgi:hypothetical protein
MNETVHVFVGEFASRDAACAYTEQQWEPEPADSVSDEAYEAWEERNPSWNLRDDLAPRYLSPDFIETITADDRYEYLSKLLARSEDASHIKIEAGGNTLVLIFSGAFAEFSANVHSTPALKYLGEFPCDLQRWRE